MSIIANSIVFNEKLNKQNVYFRPESFDAHEFLSIWKSTYMLYNDKKEVVARYESYGYSPNIGDLEVFYNPFLFVKMLKESHCDSYEEKKNKYQQMINQAIIIQPRM